MLASLSAGSDQIPAITGAKFSSRCPKAGLGGADPLSGTVDRMEMHARACVRCLLAMLDVSSDCFVGELGDELSFPVMLHALRDETVEGAVERRERHNADLLRLHFSNFEDGESRPFPPRSSS